MIQPLINPSVITSGRILSLSASQELLGVSQKLRELDALLLTLQAKELEQDNAIKANKDKNTAQDESIRSMSSNSNEDENGVDL